MLKSVRWSLASAVPEKHYVLSHSCMFLLLSSERMPRVPIRSAGRAAIGNKYLLVWNTHLGLGWGRMYSYVGRVRPAVKAAWTCAPSFGEPPVCVALGDSDCRGRWAEVQNERPPLLSRFPERGSHRRAEVVFRLVGWPGTDQIRVSGPGFPNQPITNIVPTYQYMYLPSFKLLTLPAPSFTPKTSTVLAVLI